MDSEVSREVLFDDGEGNRLWCIRDYETHSLEDLSGLDLVVEPQFFRYGKVCRQRRCVGFFSDESEGYMYSGQMIAASPLTPLLDQVMQRVNEDSI